MKLHKYIYLIFLSFLCVKAENFATQSCIINDSINSIAKYEISQQSAHISQLTETELKTYPSYSRQMAIDDNINEFVDIKARVWQRPFGLTTIDGECLVIFSPHLILDFVREDGSIESDTLSLPSMAPNGDGTFQHPTAAPLGSIVFPGCYYTGFGGYRNLGFEITDNEYINVSKIEGELDGTLTNKKWEIILNSTRIADGDSKIWEFLSGSTLDKSDDGPSGYNSISAKSNGFLYTGANLYDHILHGYGAPGYVNRPSITGGIGVMSINYNFWAFHDNRSTPKYGCNEYTWSDSEGYIEVALPVGEWIGMGEIFLPEEEDILPWYDFSIDSEDLPPTDEYAIIRKLKITFNGIINNDIEGKYTFNCTYKVTQPTTEAGIAAAKAFGWID